MQFALEEPGVEQAGHLEKEAPRPRRSGHFHGRQRRGFQGFTEQAPAGQGEVHQRHQAIFNDRRGLPDPVVFAHDLEQSAQFLEARELGWDAFAGVGIVGQVVEGQSVGAQSQIALLHGGFQQPLHGHQFLLGGRSADAGFQSHDFHSQHGVGHKSGDIGAQGQLGEVIHVVTGVVPGDLLAHLAQHRFGNILHPGKAVDDRFLVARLLAAEAGTQAAISDQYRRGPVPNDFGQRRFHVNFQIQVGVYIEHARKQPLAGGFHHSLRMTRRQVFTTGYYAALPDSHILNDGRFTAAVK